MKRNEFDRWLSDYVGKFPSTGIWLSELGEAVTESQRTLWADILDSVSLAEGKRATLAMARGEYPAVGSTNSDREQTALKVRDVVRAMKREEQEQTAGVHPDDEYQDYRRGRSGKHVGPGVLQQFIDLKAQGLTQPEICASIFGPTTDADRSGPRYRCAPCRDRGWREVWHFSSMQAYLHGLITLEGPFNTHRTMVVPCCCSAGEAHCLADGEENRKGRRNPKHSRNMMYDLEKFCPVSSRGVTDPAAIGEFLEWCKNYFEERERERLLRLQYEDPTFK